MKLSDMIVNTKAAEEGTWVGKKHGTPIEGFGDLCLKVRGMDTARFRELQASKIEALTESDRTVSGKIKQAVSDRIYRECLNEAVLDDWQFMLDDEGGEISFSPDLKTKILMHDATDLFRTAVFRASQIVGAMKGRLEDVIQKN